LVLIILAAIILKLIEKLANLLFKAAPRFEIFFMQSNLNSLTKVFTVIYRLLNIQSNTVNLIHVKEVWSWRDNLV
jgi:hypothetical protein